jgi:hypothetical protein
MFRPTVCNYSLLGCNWNGSFHNLPSHLTVCEYLTKTGSELIDTIQAQKRAYDEEKKCLETVVDLLSLNQIGVSGRLLLVEEIEMIITEKFSPKYKTCFMLNRL